MYTITLNDGSKLEGLTFERNIFFSSSMIDGSKLRGKLSPVTISNNEGKSEFEDGISGTHAHMEIAYIKEIDGKYGLALGDIPDSIWEMEKLRADVDFALLLGGASF